MVKLCKHKKLSILLKILDGTINLRHLLNNINEQTSKVYKHSTKHLQTTRYIGWTQCHTQIKFNKVTFQLSVCTVLVFAYLQLT